MFGNLANTLRAATKQYFHYQLKTFIINGFNLQDVKLITNAYPITQSVLEVLIHVVTHSKSPKVFVIFSD